MGDTEGEVKDRTRSGGPECEGNGEGSREWSTGSEERERLDERAVKEGKL